MMNELQVEAVDPSFVKEGTLHAQKRSWEVLHQIRGMIQVGMSENEARILALRVFEEHGVTRHWHRPFIRFGAGTTLTFSDPIQPEYRLQEGDPFYIDLGPVWPDPNLGLSYEGDVGDTFVMGDNPEAEKCAATARSLFEEARSLWSSKALTGNEIYLFLQERATALGYCLVPGVNGHRISDFPHHKYSKNTVQEISFAPQSTRWVLEVQIVHPTLKLGAFFEDLL